MLGVYPLAVSLVTSGGSASFIISPNIFPSNRAKFLVWFYFCFKTGSPLRIPGWPQTEDLSASAYQVVGLEVYIAWLFSTVFKPVVQCYSTHSHCCEVVTIILCWDPSHLVQPCSLDHNSQYTVTHTHPQLLSPTIQEPYVCGIHSTYPLSLAYFTQDPRLCVQVSPQGASI